MLTYLYQHPFDIWLVGMLIAAVVGSFFTDWDEGETPKVKAGLRAGLLAPFWPLLGPVFMIVLVVYVYIQVSDVLRWVFTDMTWKEANDPELHAAHKKAKREKKRQENEQKIEERLKRIDTSYRT